MYRICPLFPLSTYLEPSFCVRIRPPLLPDARKLTLFDPPVTLLFSPTQNPDPRGFPDLNIHQLGRHCELLQMIQHSCKTRYRLCSNSVQCSFSCQAPADQREDGITFRGGGVTATRTICRQSKRNEKYISKAQHTR
jgi:hypothetical protein